METVDFGARPTREQLEDYISVAAWRCVDLAGKVREAQVAVLSSHSAEQLAAAIAVFEGHMVVQAADWVILAKQTKGWQTPGLSPSEILPVE
jgi:hypothetical protein